LFDTILVPKYKVLFTNLGREEVDWTGEGEGEEVGVGVEYGGKGLAWHPSRHAHTTAAITTAKFISSLWLLSFSRREVDQTLDVETPGRNL
jgi:hypothetical protein